MTPFDVVKTRLQTQATPEFVPSSHLPPPNRSATTPWPPPVASTSSAPPPASASSVANPGTCCTKTYFSSNKDKSLLCRFDPRLSSSSLPASGSHGVSVSSTPAAVYRNMSGATAFVHQLAPSPALVHAPAPISASSCLYPTLEAAAALSLPTSSSSALGGGGGGHAAHTPRHFTGFFDAVHQIVKHEGLGAMWRGTAPALAMSIPGQVVYMVGYDWGRRTAFAHAPSWAYQDSDAVSNGSATATTDGLKPTYLTAVPLVAGALSRTVVAALTSPLELVRTRLQSSSTNTSIASIIASVRADAGGLSSAWRGLPPTLWRDVPFSAVYWAGYEGIKRALTGGKGMGEGWEGQSAGGEFAVAFVAGAGSGMVRGGLFATDVFTCDALTIFLSRARRLQPLSRIHSTSSRLAVKQSSRAQAHYRRRPPEHHQL